MGALTKKDIKKYMESGKIEKRLIITPLINPNETFDPVAVDVRLGNEFIIMRKRAFPLLNIEHGEDDFDSLLIDIEKYQEKVRVNYKGEFVLHPGQLIIGSTLEYIRLPETLMCYVIGKSSWGRMGLIIATATKVDPGFKGCITLEIINEGEVPIVLYPGIPIAQLVFHETNSNVTYDGAYNCATGPEFPKFSQKAKAWEFWLPNKKL
jgi:dCTP deaminase